MDTELVWLSPEGHISFSNTLGDMISEALHAINRAKLARDSTATRAGKKKIVAVPTGTSCEATEWEADTGMNVNKNLCGGKK